MRFIVRSPLPPESLIPAVRRAIQDLDPALPIHHVAMMHDIVRDSLPLERLGSLVMMFFALAALLMASLGIYGVVSYFVRQSTVEIGTRMALGAIGRDLMSMIVSGGLRMAAYGAAIGGVAVVASSWALVRSSRSVTSARCRSSPRRRSSPRSRPSRRSSRVARHAALTDGGDPQRARRDVAVDATDAPADADRPVPGGNVFRRRPTRTGRGPA